MLVIFRDQELKFVIPIKTLRFKSFFIVVTPCQTRVTAFVVRPLSRSNIFVIYTIEIFLFNNKTNVQVGSTTCPAPPKAD